MRKKVFQSIAFTMAMLIMAGCSGNESGTDPQQENNSASSAESMTIQANESTDETAVSEAAEPVAEENSAVVYFSSDISAEGLVKIYDALGWTPEGSVADKISTGNRLRVIICVRN